MCPEYIKNSQNSIRRSNTIKNGQKKLADISQRNTDGTWAHEKMFDTYSLWKMQIKTAVRYNYLPIRRTVLTRMWNNWHSHKLLVELQSVGPLWKTLWQFLTYTYMWSSNSTSRYLPKWNENLWSHKIVMSNFTPQPRNNPNQLKNGLKKKNVVYPYHGILLAIKNKLLIDKRTWINLKCIMPGEKDYILSHSTYMTFWKRQSYRENRQ